MEYHFHGGRPCGRGDQCNDADDSIFAQNRQITSDKPDPVLKPSYYVAGGYECVEVMEAIGLSKDWYLGNAFKYIWRAGKKDDILQDLKKAVTLLNRKIVLLESAKSVFGKT